MIIAILVSCFTIMVAAVPVCPNVLPPLLSPDTQTPAPLSPELEQPQPEVPQQPDLQFLPPTQHYAWYPLGGSPMTIPLQPSVHGSQPANQPTLPQNPLMFPSYRYIPLFASPYMNQLLSQNGFQMIPESPLPQTLADQPLNSPVSPSETLSGVAPSGNAPQPMQQQNPQIVYMLQQPMNSLPVGSLSSEELELAATMGQLGVYLPTLLLHPPSGAIQHVNQAAGLTNPEQQDIVPTAGALSTGVAQTHGLKDSGPQPNTIAAPVGLERSVKEATTVPTPVQTEVQPTPGNLV